MAFSTPVLADELSCSIHPAKDTSDSDLPGLTKISKDDAQKTALAEVKGKHKKVESGELESENGCLIYSFDVRVSGKPGVEEIMVDAGNGKMLSHQHEAPGKEAAEKAQDEKSQKP
ncbi:MAG: PepSY domain-containing protein [Pseudomonadota bacterium]|nr:PepSY domain-containing protein [Pseudomonadota bacterium]